MMPMMQWWSRLPLSTESLSISRPVSSPSSPHLCECYLCRGCECERRCQSVKEATDSEQGSTEEESRHSEMQPSWAHFSSDAPLPPSPHITRCLPLAHTKSLTSTTHASHQHRRLCS